MKNKIFIIIGLCIFVTGLLYGCVEEEEENKAPTCNLNSNHYLGTAPLTVTFTITATDSDGSISSWELDTDNDGTADYSGTGNPPTSRVHTYNTQGSYTAKLTVMDNEEKTSTDTITITVNEPTIDNQSPTCTLSVTPSSGYAPLVVTFSMDADDHDGTIASWSLDINNDGTAEYSGTGVPSNTQQHTFTSTGTYTSKLTVIDNQGESDTDTATISVTEEPIENQRPTCSLFVGTNSGYAPFSVTFIISASDPDGSISSWELDVDNDGSADYSGTGNPPSTKQYTYNNVGTYTASLTVIDNRGATASYTRTIIVSEAPLESPPEIYLVTTASKVETFGNYSEKSEFERGDTIYIYYEYKNVNHENVIDTYHTLTVNHKESWKKYYSDEDDSYVIDDGILWAKWWWFDTDNSWPSGQYQVDIGVLDQITGKTDLATIYFNLTDVSGSQGYSRSNPAPIGSTLLHEEEDDWLYGDYKARITLIQVIRGAQAWTMIEDANMFNDEPEPGYEYILAKIRFEYMQSSEQDTQYSVTEYDFTVVSESGVDYDLPSVVEPEPDLDGNLYPGATVEGWAAYQVAINDHHPLLTFGRDWQGRGGIWFKLY